MACSYLVGRLPVEKLDKKENKNKEKESKTLQKKAKKRKREREGLNLEENCCLGFGTAHIGTYRVPSPFSLNCSPGSVKIAICHFSQKN